MGFEDNCGLKLPKIFLKLSKNPKISQVVFDDNNAVLIK